MFFNPFFVNYYFFAFKYVSWRYISSFRVLDEGYTSVCLFIKVIAKYKKAKRKYNYYRNPIERRYRMNLKKIYEIGQKISSIDQKIIQLRFGVSSYESTRSTLPTTDTNTGSKGESSHNDDQPGPLDPGNFFQKNPIVAGTAN